MATNMKNKLTLTITLLLAVTLLSSCGRSKSNSGGSGNDNAAGKSINEVIKASALISLKDATLLLGQQMEEDSDVGKLSFQDRCEYVSDTYRLDVALWQEALHDKNSDFEKNLLRNGWISYLKQMQKAFASNYYNQNIVEMGGVEGESYMQKGLGFGQWLLYIFYGEYWIVLTLGNAPGATDNSEEAVAWRQEKLKEAGNLAVTRLKEILK